MDALRTRLCVCVCKRCWLWQLSLIYGRGIVLCHPSHPDAWALTYCGQNSYEYSVHRVSHEYSLNLYLAYEAETE